MDYTDVVTHLLSILMMVINKNDTLVLTPEASKMLTLYMQVDELI